MARAAAEIRPFHVIVASIRDLFRLPFLILVAIALFINVVSAGVPADDLGLLLTLVLFALSIYVQIAIVLAAGAPEPGRAADPWVRAAIKQRCFWRYVLTGFAIVVFVGLGLLVLIVPGLIAGAVLAVAQPAAVLERRRVPEALMKSRELTRADRVGTGLIFFFMVLVPGGATLILNYVLNPRGAWALGVGSLLMVFSVASLIALTRTFLLLGGLRAGEEEPRALGRVDEGAPEDAEHDRRGGGEHDDTL
jgi:hypothetical protein